MVKISDPLLPVQEGNIYVPSAGMSISGEYAYVASESDGLRVIDISRPNAPRHVGFYHTPRSARDVAVAGAYAYVAEWERIQVLNVSDPRNPTEASVCQVPGRARRLAR